jgi:hypothetical protein
MSSIEKGRYQITVHDGACILTQYHIPVAIPTPVLLMRFDSKIELNGLIIVSVLREWLEICRIKGLSELSCNWSCVCKEGARRKRNYNRERKEVGGADDPEN